MANFSLISVTAATEDGRVSGNWIQDKIACTLAEAIAWAVATEAANSNKIDVAVLPDGPAFRYVGEQVYLCKRLDTPRRSSAHGL